MRAVQFSRFGAPEEVVELVDLPDVAPGPGQVAVDFLAAPVNPADLLNLQGLYGIVPPLPAIAGLEGVGRVSAVGPDVTHLRVGDRVLLGGSTWRERHVLPAAGLFSLPSGVPDEQLAMLTVNPLTARALLREARLAPGDWLIKNAANSGVGRILLALARRAGVRTIAVVRRPGLEDTLKSWGAEAVLVDGPDLPAQVKQLVGDARVPHAIDAIGGAATARLAASVSPGGTVVNYGVLSGEPCHASGVDLIFRDVHLRGFWLATWFRRTAPVEVEAAYAELIDLLVKGEITVPVEATYPLTRVRDALRHAAQPGRGGKIVLVAERGAAA